MEMGLSGGSSSDSSGITCNNDISISSASSGISNYNSSQGRRLRVASGATAPGPALEGASRFRPMSLSSYILR